MRQPTAIEDRAGNEIYLQVASRAGNESLSAICGAIVGYEFTADDKVSNTVELVDGEDLRSVQYRRA